MPDRVTGCIASFQDRDRTLESPPGQRHKHRPVIEDDKHSAAHETLIISFISGLALAPARPSATVANMAALLGDARNRRH